MSRSLKKILEFSRVVDAIEEVLNDENSELFVTGNELEARDITGRKILTASLKEPAVFYGNKMHEISIMDLVFDKSKIAYKE